MKKRTKLLITAFVPILTGILAVLFMNMGVISHASSRAPVSAEPFLRCTLASSGSRYELIFNDTSVSYRGRYISTFLMDLYPDQEKPADLKVTAFVADRSEKGTYDPQTGLTAVVFSDLNPIYVKTEVLRMELDHVTALLVEGQNGTTFRLGEVSIDNGFRWNWYLFLFGAVSGLILCLVLAPAVMRIFLRVRTRALPDPEAGSIRKTEEVLPSVFLLCALLLGGTLAVCLPANKVGCDEETHLQAVLQMAGFPSGSLHLSDGIVNQISVTEYNNPAAQPAGSEEQQQFKEALSADADYKQGQNTHRFYVMANRMPAYFAMAAAVKIAKGLSLSWPVILLLARLVNLLQYAALLYLALRLLPCGRMLMTVIGLLPQNLFLGATISYDAFITGCTCVGLAFLLKILDDTEKGAALSVKDTAWMLLFLLLACTVKAVYAPLVLAALVVPAAAFRDRQHRVFYGAAVVFVFLFTALLFILPTVIAPSSSGDVRGGETVSEVSQIGFILGDPLAYTGILLSQMVRWIPQCIIGPDCTTFMGHLVTAETGSSGAWIPYFVMILLPVLFGAVRFFLETAGGKPHFLSVWQKLWILLTCFGASVLIWTAMYVAFTPPGAPEIAGVQGRYFIPILFPLYFALGGDGPAAAEHEGDARIARTEQICYDSMIAAAAVLTVLSVANGVVLPYCL